MEANHDLESLYSPSHFSKRFKTPDEVINHHVEFISEGKVYRNKFGEYFKNMIQLQNQKRVV